MLSQRKGIPWNIFYTIFYSIIVSLFLLSSNTGFAETPISSTQCQSKITNIQRIKFDTPNIKSLPERGWEDVKTLPDYWDKKWNNYSGSAWYKVQWNHTCPPNSYDPVTLVINHFNMAGEIYLNNEFLWKDKSLVEPLSRSWHNPRYWILPNSSLNQGENSLLIRIVGTSTQKSGLGLVSLGENSQMMDIYHQAVLEKRTLPTLNFIINLIVGLFCLMVWLFIPSEHAFKWFALITFAWLLYSLTVLIPETIFSLESTTIDRISIVFFSNYVSFGCLAAWRFAQRIFPKTEKILLIFCIASTFISLLIPDEYLRQTLNIIFLIGVTIFILKCLTYPFIAYKSKLKEAYILAIQYLFFFPIAVNDAIYMLTLKGQILSPYTAPMSSLIIGFILAYRLSNNAKSIALFNKTLEQKVIQATEELSISLNNQHQLALENAKLQERINLSHDLHDGLGGSISRSLIMLENHEQVEKKQMLSILKLLRNDLRQTIDFGSSQESKIPETPILWAAHLRHRFVLIFEELEIKSKWILDDQWQTEPNALQCLTLARVAEEALNNIIKHSNANEVTVSLSENGHYLILEIIDNGVGFDLEQVETGLHVGLHSMQQRVKRLNGLFDIHSQTGQTTLKISIPFHTKTS